MADDHPFNYLQGVTSMAEVAFRPSVPSKNCDACTASARELAEAFNVMSGEFTGLRTAQENMAMKLPHGYELVSEAAFRLMAAGIGLTSFAAGVAVGVMVIVLRRKR